MADWAAENPWPSSLNQASLRGVFRGRARGFRGRGRGRGGGASSPRHFGLLPDWQLRYEPYRLRSG